MGTTGIIKYNVNERGRVHRGVDRNFDTRALAELINGGATQERVKHGDMVGYYGHWPRIKFGMNPAEGGIVDGKQVALEPAIRTVMLRASADGTIEHESEFLDNPSGKLAERLFKTKAGGFSSAIDHKRCGDISLPLAFYGFDYVLEPNYTTNRGYDVALDSINGTANMALLDSAECLQMFDTVNRMYDQLQEAYELVAQTNLLLQQENDEMISMLAGKDGKRLKALDAIAPDIIRIGENGRFSNAAAFMNAPLVGLESPAPSEEKTRTKKADTVIDRLFRQGR